MEDLFYQFYDILVIAVTAVIMYVSVKNGISKTFPLIIGYALSFFIAFGFSGKSADYIYPEFFKEKNVEGICRNITDFVYTKLYNNIGSMTASILWVLAAFTLGEIITYIIKKVPIINKFF